MDAIRVIQEVYPHHGSLQSIGVQGLRRLLEEATSGDSHWFLNAANTWIPADRQLIRLVKQIIEGPADLARSNPSHIAFLALGALTDNSSSPQPFEPISDARTLRQYRKVVETLVLMVEKRTTNIFHAGRHPMPEIVEEAASSYFDRPEEHGRSGYLDSGDDDVEWRAKLLRLLRAILLGRDDVEEFVTSPISSVVWQFVIMQNKSGDRKSVV